MLSHFPYLSFRLWYPFCASRRRSSAVSTCHWGSGTPISNLTISFGKYRSGSNLKSLATSCCQILGPSDSLARFVAGQFVGGVDLPQELLCGQVPLHIFLPCQPRVLAPLLILLIVHRYQVGALGGGCILPAEQAGTTGPHWPMEQTTALAESMGLSWDQISPWCWWIAVNMMYSDYGGVAIHYGVSTAEFFAELARAFLFDKDGPGPKEKLAAYYHGIVKPGK